VSALLGGTHCEERDYLKHSAAGWTRQVLAERGIRQTLEESGDEVTHKGPEHKMRTMMKSHPRRPVPMTAMKMAAGAASKNLIIGQ